MVAKEQFASLSTEPRYNTKAVVQRTGIPADTLRAWERRYGVPKPQRSPGRQRTYSERDIAILCWLRDQTEAGISIRHAAAAISAAAAPSAPSAPSAHIDELRKQAMAALLEFDTLSANSLITAALAHYPVETVCLELIQPLLYAIGQGWQEQSISIAQEHAATAFLRAKLESFLLHAATPTTRGTIALATAPEEHHEIGLLMVALFLMRRGWQVRFLGSNLPGDELLETVRLLKPDLVALSAATPTSRATTIVLLQALVSLPDAPVVGFGGTAFSAAESRRGVPGHFLGFNAHEVCETVETLIGR